MRITPRRLVRKALRTARGLRGGRRRLNADAHHQERTQTLRGPGYIQHSGRRFVVVRSMQNPGQRRTGIVLSGGCDLATSFTAIPLVAEHLQGDLAILNHGTGSVIGAHRTDQILRQLSPSDPSHLQEASARLGLDPDYFRPLLFDASEFSIEGHERFGTFPKTVIVLSIGSDLVRVVYRHREHGYLVDPGGYWQNQLSENLLPDPNVARWFKENFENIGRISVTEFHSNLARVITEIRSRLGAHVVVYNSLVVDPGSRTHNYQLLPGDHSIRRREFNLALSDLSTVLGFHILDVDRILKEQGVQQQVDFAHVPTSKTAPIGVEFYRILREIEVL